MSDAKAAGFPASKADIHQLHPIGGSETAKQAHYDVEPEDLDVDADEVDAFLRDNDTSSHSRDSGDASMMPLGNNRSATSSWKPNRRRRRGPGIGAGGLGGLLTLPLRLVQRAYETVVDGVVESSNSHLRSRSDILSNSPAQSQSRWTSIRKAVIRIALIYVSFTTIIFLFFAYFAPLSYLLLPPVVQNAKKVLLVVAHPDDECLFFSPTLSTFAHRLSGIDLSILVMSLGNNYGLGETRRKELQGSCAMYNVPTERCEVLDLPDIQDNPTVWWPTTEIAEIIGERVKKWNVDTVFSFDEGGISGHINHRAVSESVVDYALTHHNINVYLVYTTAIIRKYTVWFDFAWSALPTVLWRCLPFTTGVQKPSTAYTIHSFKLWRVAYKAFSAHASQWEGPRTLFLYLNRYMWYNELVIHQIGR